MTKSHKDLGEGEKLLSVKEYADSQGITTAAVYNRRSRGRLTLVKQNGRLLVYVPSYEPGKSGRPKKNRVN
jgi:hypothetical protein